MDTRQRHWRNFFSDGPARSAIREHSHHFKEQLSLLTKYGRYIRGLHIEHTWVIYITIYAQLSQLRTLYIRPGPRSFTEPDDLTVDSDMPTTTFTKKKGQLARTTMNRTQAFWQLIIDNPNLERVVLSSNAEKFLNSFVPSNLHSLHYRLKPESEAFVVMALSGLTKLRHLEIGGAPPESSFFRGLLLFRRSRRLSMRAGAESWRVSICFRVSPWSV